MDILFVPDATHIPLIPRPAYASMVVSGNPKVSGRIVSLSEDKRAAQVIWRSTPGTFRFKPDSATADCGCVVSGRAIIRRTGRADIHLSPGSLIEFPREPFEMEVIERFTWTRNQAS